MHDLILLPHTAIKCPDAEILKPMNGRVVAKEQTFGSIAEYACNDGFELTGGNKVRECLATGSWSGIAPFCQCKITLHCIIVQIKQHSIIRHLITCESKRKGVCNIC